MCRRFLLPLLLWCLAATGVQAAGPAFDLAGPKVDVHVKRGDITLPISETPNLLPGDRLWIHPDLPANQSAHFVLVIAFLRGATNPPPPDWFTRVETWNPDVRSEGIFVRVPSGAQQALLFLVPETGGDFNTLRSTVRSMPGSFVRAAQDLQAASWERMRLEAYLREVKVTSQTNPATLKVRAEMAARSLGIKINESCFDKPADQQVSCLSQNSEGMVLDDTNAQSLVAQLTNGDTLNLVNAISSTNMAGGGVYSPYIGAIVDTARILSSLRTAHFQYIPALALPTADTLNLRLNMPPSFRNPKSVVVIALPPLGPARPEPLHSVNPGDEFCVQRPGLVLPAEGAPLFFAAHMAHDLVLHIESENSVKGLPVDLAVVADSARGGLVLLHPAPLLPEGELTGVIRGKWGFDDWSGPHYLLLSSRPGHWALTSGDESALVVGRTDTLHLTGQNTLCVDRVEARTKGADPMELAWKPSGQDSFDLTVPLKNAEPGPVELSIYQFGLAKPQKLSLRAYADAASLQSLFLSAGDKTALLKGTRLDEVARAEFDGITWTPGDLTRVQDLDQLVLNTTDSTTKLKPGKHYTAIVHLEDDRKLKVSVRVDPPRPQAVLLSKGVQEENSGQPSPVVFGNPEDLPVQGRLVFFLKATTPPTFSRNEKVEVAAGDSSFHTMLDLAKGDLMLEDSSTAVGSLEPLKSFGLSAFGPLRVRVIAADGAAGDWLPLGTLVRLPGFKELRCPRSPSLPCLLSGSNLFLAASFSATPGFDNPTDIPMDFTGTEITVPHPVGGALYMKLRDDPATVQTLKMPVAFVPRHVIPAAEPRKESNSEETPANGGAPATELPTTSPATSPASPASQAPGQSPSGSGEAPNGPPVASPAPASQSAPTVPQGSTAPANPASQTPSKVKKDGRSNTPSTSPAASSSGTTPAPTASSAAGPSGTQSSTAGAATSKQSH